MKKAILITLAPILLIDTYITYSMNYKGTEKPNNSNERHPLKRLHHPKTSLIFSGNSETGKDILIKTPSLYHRRTGTSSPNQIDVKVFF